LLLIRRVLGGRLTGQNAVPERETTGRDAQLEQQWRLAKYFVFHLDCDKLLWVWQMIKNPFKQ
jgi:hypothetical protein